MSYNAISDIARRFDWLSGSRAVEMGLGEQSKKAWPGKVRFCVTFNRTNARSCFAGNGFILNHPKNALSRHQTRRKVNITVKIPNHNHKGEEFSLAQSGVYDQPTIQEQLSTSEVASFRWWKGCFPQPKHRRHHLPESETIPDLSNPATDPWARIKDLSHLGCHAMFYYSLLRLCPHLCYYYTARFTFLCFFGCRLPWLPIAFTQLHGRFCLELNLLCVATTYTIRGSQSPRCALLAWDHALDLSSPIVK